MVEEYEKKRRTQVTKMRSIMDYTMGILFLMVGTYFFIYRYFGWNLMDREPSSLDYFLGALFVFYGVWRIYRGYKKNYFRE